MNFEKFCPVGVTIFQNKDILKNTTAGIVMQLCLLYFLTGVIAVIIKQNIKLEIIYQFKNIANLLANYPISKHPS